LQHSDDTHNFYLSTNKILTSVDLSDYTSFHDLQHHWKSCQILTILDSGDLYGCGRHKYRYEKFKISDC